MKSKQKCAKLQAGNALLFIILNHSHKMGASNNTIEKTTSEILFEISQRAKGHKRDYDFISPQLFDEAVAGKLGITVVHPNTKGGYKYFSYYGIDFKCQPVSNVK
jgi:hypothetical protein